MLMHNNRSVIAHQYPTLYEQKVCPPSTIGSCKRKGEPNKLRIDLNFKLPNKFNYLKFDTGTIL